MNKTNNKKYGLIGKLYHNVLSYKYFKYRSDEMKCSINEEIKNCFSPKDFFQKKWLAIENTNDTYWSMLAKHDAFISSYKDDVSSFLDDTERFEITIKNELEIYKNIVSLNEIDILNKLIESLRSTLTYRTDRNHLSDELKYDENAKARLILYFESNEHSINLPHFIRLYIYFACHNSIPDNLAENISTEEDLDEFTNLVIKRYGTTSKHAIRAIIALATRGLDDNSYARPNSIALYEYAELLYYGNDEGIERNIEKAFKYYKISAGIEDYDEQIHRASNPLALWSLAFIYLNYKVKNTPLSNCPTIKEIETLTPLNRIKRAYLRASQAYAFSHLPAAANILGKIAQLTERNYVGIDKFKKEVNIKEPNVYYRIAAEGGYVYAYNNLAELERQLIFEAAGDEKSQSDHINNYIYYLSKASQKNEPWAANKLGRIYLEGITGKDSKTGEIIHIDYLVDKEKSFNYFRKAYLIYHIFSDENCAWACAHLLHSFSNRLSATETNEVKRIITMFSQHEDIIKLAFGKES